MNDLLQQEIAGAPVTVRIRGTERPLAYPMHAVILYKQLTAKPSTKALPQGEPGDSLFVAKNFQKIDLATDPERWLKCLWAGLHQLEPETLLWKAPCTLEELQALVDFSNAGEISIAMVRALTQSMPKAKEVPDPNVEAAAGKPEAALSMTLPGSMPVPAAASDSPAPNS